MLLLYGCKVKSFFIQFMLNLQCSAEEFLAENDIFDETHVKPIKPKEI